MQAHPTTVEGCSEIELDPSFDRRGSFLKLFQSTAFSRLGLSLDVRELFISRSVRDVLRGLHFQAPPADVAKLVSCLAGAVLDVVVDLRVGSPTYLGHCAVELSAERANAILVPFGCAHGFLTTSDEAVVMYAQSGEHDPLREGGVLWSSAGIAWPVAEPILSDRDASFPTLAGLDSSFRYRES